MEKILLLLAVLPSIVLGKYVDYNDKFGKEPRGLLIKCFMGGLGAVIGVLIVSSIVGIFIDMDRNASDMVELFIKCLLEIALIEEGCKYFFLKKITWNNKEFDHIYDAIVYSVFVSLGFATIENIIYVFSDGGSLSTAIIRAFLSVPGHAFFGVFMGYYYGIAKQYQILSNQKLCNNNLTYAIIVPTLLHGIFDFCLYSESLLIICIYLVFIVCLYIFAFKTIREISKINTNMK